VLPGQRLAAEPFFGMRLAVEIYTDHGPDSKGKWFSTSYAHSVNVLIIMLVSLAVSILLARVGTTYASKSTGCGQPLSKDLSKGQTGDSNALTFDTSDGTERSYLLHIPDSYDVNTPTGLIWSYHGRGKDSLHQEKISGFSKKASSPGYIVIYPQGTSKNAGKLRTLRRQATDDDDDEEEETDDGDEYGGDIQTSSSSGKSGSKKGAWQGDPNVQTDDVKFTLELLDNITKTFCIDEDKVYASGISNGGGFVANVLACDSTASTKFAAFASASGAYYQNGLKDKCDPKNVPITCNNNGVKTPLIVTGGGKDKTIPNGGGERRKSCLPSVEHFVTAVAQRDGLGTTNVQSKVNSSDVVHYTFGRDAGLGMVQYYYIPKMGHTWPTGGSGTQISATKVFMEFFANWTLTTRDEAAKSLPTSDSSTSSKAAGQLQVTSCHMLGLVVAVFGALYLV
jgi:poly(3-hydroxybutyrate) depolymerase